MSVFVTYETLSAEFDILQAVFESGRREPFTSISMRRAYAAGASTVELTTLNRKRHLAGLPLKRTPLPDESDYVAVIKLSGSTYYGNSMVRDYVFKIREDGCFAYNIPFEYSKQSIGKWVKYIGRWLNGMEALSGLRQQERCRSITLELLGKTPLLDYDD